MTGGAGTVAPRPPRVAMVIQRFRPHFSGQGEQMELLCKCLAARGARSTIITSAYDDPSSEETLNGYGVVRLGSDMPQLLATTLGHRGRNRVFAFRVVAYLLRHDRFDLVHVHASTDALYTSWLWCRIRRRPILFEMTLIGADDAITVMARNGRLDPVRQALFRRCDGYVAISPALEQRYHQAGLPAGNVRILPQGVDVDEFRPMAGSEETRREWGVPASSPVLMFIGSLIHRKGIDVLLRAWAQIHAVRPDAHLVLVGKHRFRGDPESERFLANEIARLPRTAAAHMHQLGVRHDVSRLLRAADLFLFPSRREGFGMVMIEAMACGLPCVVAALPGITNFVFGDDGSAGIIVPQADPGALVAAANTILASPDRAAEMGRRARERAVGHFDIERITDRYTAYYAELIARRKARSGV